MKKKLVTFAFMILCNFPTFGQVTSRDIKLPSRTPGYIFLLIIPLGIILIAVIIRFIVVVFRRKGSKHKSGVCANCGQEIKEGNKFCTKCGSKIL